MRTERILTLLKNQSNAYTQALAELRRAELSLSDARKAYAEAKRRVALLEGTLNGIKLAKAATDQENEADDGIGSID